MFIFQFWNLCGQQVKAINYLSRSGGKLLYTSHPGKCYTVSQVCGGWPVLTAKVIWFSPCVLRLHIGQEMCFQIWHFSPCQPFVESADTHSIPGFSPLLSLGCHGYTEPSSHHPLATANCFQTFGTLLTEVLKNQTPLCLCFINHKLLAYNVHYT